MSDTHVTDTPAHTDNSVNSDERLCGRVKWFNNRAGFGFITVVGGEKSGSDIFAHHSGIKVGKEQYKYLVQGEYVNFNLRTSESSEHPYQAGDITGVMDGPLMCETRNLVRDSDETRQPDRRRPRKSSGTRYRGAGPRDGMERSSRRWEMGKDSSDEKGVSQ